jgi:hypothetical protein
VDGRPVVIDADDGGVVVSLTLFAAAWGVKRSATALLPVLGVARRCGVPLRLSVAGLISLEVLPRPHRVLRLLAPRLAELG